MQIQAPHYTSTPIHLTTSHLTNHQPCDKGSNIPQPIGVYELYKK